MEFHILIDTCVWLDLAKNQSDEPVISALENMVESGSINLLVPNLVKAEFARNKDRVAETTRQRLSQEFRKIRKVVEQFGDPEKRQTTIQTLDDVHHRLPILTDAVFSTIHRIEDLLEKGTQIEESAEAKLRAAERALSKKAPFHKHKNSMSDSVLMETYAGLLNSNGVENIQFFFITHNTNDFSSPTDNRLPHPDFSDCFSDSLSQFHINLASALQQIDQDILQEYTDEYEWTEETRGLTQILKYIDELAEKIWFSRHCLRAEGIEEGRTKVVPVKDYKGHNPHEIREDIWQGALAAAENVMERYPNDLGPWTDFEWGMLNGKLSALRWVLGDEWDMLDT
jgi:hypothetical protein